MSHLTKQERCKIENLLNPRKAASTIRQEIRKHRHEGEEAQKGKKNFCSQRKSCFVKNLCKVPPGNRPAYCRY